MPIPNQVSIDNLLGTEIFIKLGLRSNQAKTNSIMTHILVLSAKVRENEHLWQTLDIGNMFEPTFGFKTS